MRRFILPAIGLLLVLAAPIRAQEPAAEQKKTLRTVRSSRLPMCCRNSRTRRTLRG